MQLVIDGYVGPGGHTLITKILNLLKEEELLPGTTLPSMKCLDHSEGVVKCLPNVELIEFDVLNLPWLDVITLSGTKFLDTLSSGGNGKTSYNFRCEVLGLEEEVLCEVEPTAELTNETGGVLGVFEEGETVNLPGTCLSGGTALTVGEELTVDSSAGTLTVS
jgi:hypothetical protein